MNLVHSTDSQCKPATSTCTNALSGQCGGSGWTGATCCESTEIASNSVQHRILTHSHPRPDRIRLCCAITVVQPVPHWRHHSSAVGRSFNHHHNNDSSSRYDNNGGDHDRSYYISSCSFNESACHRGCLWSMRRHRLDRRNSLRYGLHLHILEFILFAVYPSTRGRAYHDNDSRGGQCDDNSFCKRKQFSIDNLQRLGCGMGSMRGIGYHLLL